MAMSLKTIFDPAGKTGTIDKKTGRMNTTPMSFRNDDGIYVGTNGQVWLYWVLPTSPLVWEDPGTRLMIGGPLHEILVDLGATSRKSLIPGFKFTSDNREFHICALQWDERPTPPKGTSDELASFMNETFTFKAGHKLVFVGTKLRSGGTQAIEGQDGIIPFMTRLVKEATTDDIPDLNDYKRDFDLVASILARNGCRRPTMAESRHMESWYNLGRGTDCTLVAEPSGKSLSSDAWPDGIELSALVHFDQTEFQSPADMWAADAFSHEEGLICLSIRGDLMPAEEARNEFRKAQRKALSQIEEQSKTGDLERVEDHELFQLANSMESYFAGATEPLLTNCSILLARRATKSDDTYADALRSQYGFEVKPLEHRQMLALDETLPCSDKRLGRTRPFAQDLTVGMLAYSGLMSFSAVGDDHGVFVGLAPPDMSPVFLDPKGSSTQDKPPAMAVVGEPGSGKLLTFSTPLATPTGFTTMGDVSEGDVLLGRDGKPCRVVKVWPTIETPELFDVHLSDGQVVRACVDHQWLVSTRGLRLAPVRPGRLAAVDRWDRSRSLIDGLVRLADDAGDASLMDSDELLAAVRDEVGDLCPWSNAKSLKSALDVAGVPSVREERVRSIRFSGDLVKSDPSVLYPTRDLLEAAIGVWSNLTGANRVRWGAQAERRVAAAQAVLAVTPEGDEANIPTVLRRMTDAGCPMPKSSKGSLRAAAKQAGVASRRGRAQVVVPMPTETEMTVERAVWPASVAFKALAARVEASFDERPSVEVDERVMTTGEMLAEGVVLPGDRLNFAIRTTEPLDLPEADLPVPPYVLGAWLGDGTTISGGFTGIDSEITDEIEASGYEVTHSKSVAKAHHILGLVSDLRAAGVLGDKHIPMLYLRASFEQRLAVLQGLMDTDGTIDVNGNCELTFCNERLATDALDLIRTLGIKAAMTSGDAVLTEDDPDRPGERRRRITGTRWRIHFTTNLPVFRLPRKAERLPTEVRDTQKRIYITAIEPAPTEPGRCITVDSPDSTFLCAGYVPTRNTFLCQLIAFQAALQGHTSIVINPKPSDSLRPFAELVDGEVITISALENEPGALDPFRYAPAQTAAEIATAHILSMLVQFTEYQEVELASGIKAGAMAGAKCVGDALRHVSDTGMVDLIRKQCEGSSLFSLGIAWTERPPLGFGDKGKLTLIEFDRPVSLPTHVAPVKEYDRETRASVAAMRLVTRASLEMLFKSGGGVLVVDEAHVFLSSKEGVGIMQRIGREGRSQGILPILATQRIADLIETGVDMESYIGRVMALKMTDPREVRAALRMVGLDPTPQRIQWLANAGAVKATPESPGRGALGFFRDLAGRRSATMIGPVPEYVRLMFSTNHADRAARQAIEDARAASRAETLGL